MKNLVKYTLFALVAVTLTGCIASDFEDGTLCRDGVLSISVSTSSAGTRGQGDNDDMPTAESIVKDLQYFLYVKGSGVDAAPIYAGTITGITDNDDIDNDSNRPNTPADEDDKFSKTVQIPAVALNQLFPNKETTECEIYIIANYIDNGGNDLTKDLASATRQKLKAIRLNTTFYELSDDGEKTPTSFVMDSEGTDTDIVSRGTGNTLTSGTIYLTRAAAKVMIEVNVQNAIDVSGNEWEPISYVDPNTKQMLISFYNGVTTGVIDDGTDVEGSTAVTVTDDNAYYMVENVLLHGVKISGGGATGDTSSVTRADEPTLWVSNVDFYSYANSWTAGDEDHEPYFKISIPWRKKSDSANWVTYTYTVPIGMKFNRFDRNKLYLIRLNVGALGDLNYLNDSVLSFRVFDWNSQDVNVSLDNPRYLVVNEHSYEMDNVEEILIPYSSSHECVITDLTVKRDNLYAGSEASKDDKNSTHSADLVTIDGKTYIKVYNDLDNNIFANNSFNTNFDFTKYTITLTISHKNADGSANSTYTENIEILQYPALFGVSQLNSNAERTNKNDKNGFVWVNSYRGSAPSGVTDFDDCDGTSSSTESARSMYVFTVSSVQGTDYVIGDPRTREIDNLDGYNFTWGSGYSLYSKSNRADLLYYYPTDGNYDDDETTSHTYNMVAPKFRISSGYGAIDANSAEYRDEYKYVKGRCASYQEDGYPAGRWRLPTAAEFELVNTLVNVGELPELYVKGMNYWCAHGYGYYQNGSVQLSDDASYGNVGQISVRCVYDDWYWGSEPVNDNRNNPDGDKFTWGDEPRPTATAK